MKYPNSFAYLCNEYPFSVPRFENFDCRSAIVFTNYSNADAWKCFVALGKIIHEKVRYKVRGPESRYPYYPENTIDNKIRTISQLSQDEIRVSVEMIDEMLSIFNKYMVKTHETVPVDFADGRGYVDVKVLKPKKYDDAEAV